MKIQLTGLFFGCLIAGGCSGTLKMESFDMVDNELPTGGIEGVLVYPQALFVEVYQKTTLVDKKGNLLGRSSDGTCAPVSVAKLAYRPDLAHPMRINYEPGLLEKFKFSVTLKEGMLTAVNSESEPDRAATLKNLGEAIPSLGGFLGLGVEDQDDTTGTVALLPEEPVKACNSGLTFEDLIKYAP